MKNLLSILAIAIFSLQSLSLYAQENTEKGYHEWWKDGFRFEKRDDSRLKILPLITVNGNRFINSKGDTVLFRGLSISDPDKIEHEGHWNRELFQKVKDMGTLVVRIPVHPVAWRERTPDQYLVLLDQAVDWCTGLGMYVDIDWHTIGNLRMELFQNPMYVTTQQETFEFWRTISRHFRGNNTVAFYEIFNEPTIYRGQLGSMSWHEWKLINEDIIRLIRSYDAETIPLVAGLDWAYDLTPLHDDPVNAERIAYVTHPYAHKRTEPWEPKWEEDFGFAANEYPLVATEFGFGVRPDDKITEKSYGPRIIAYLEGKGISWMCWVFDPEWGPRMIKSWDTFELTQEGDFFKKAMSGK